MPRCRVDKSIDRVTLDGFTFPLGVYPVEDVTPRQGYTMSFEAADGGDGERGAGGTPGGDAGGARGGRGESDPDSLADGPQGGGDEWEEWPDRYVWDICITSSRLEALTRALFSLLPGRVYPILDVLGQDAYREIDPYVAYELVGLERFMDAVRQYRGYFYEDGLVGFGAMAEEPFFYVFVDEHKVVTVRAAVELKERVERVLQAFDLEQVEQIAAADAALHEHRTVLDTPADRPDLLTPDEIVEDLRDMWGLSLNVDPERNVDEEGEELGIVGWRVVVRAVMPGQNIRYAEVLLTAENLAIAHELAQDAAQHLCEEYLSASPQPTEATEKSLDKPKAKGPARQEESAEARGEEGDVPEPDEGDESSDNDADDAAELDVMTADRARPEDFRKILAEAGPVHAPADLSLNRVCHAAWMA